MRGPCENNDNEILGTRTATTNRNDFPERAGSWCAVGVLLALYYVPKKPLECHLRRSKLL